jgi:hypothetical protein
MERSLRPILRLKKVRDPFLAREKLLKTMLKKWKRDPKINPNPKSKFKLRLMLYHGAINKITKLKTKFHKKSNSKKGRKKRKRNKGQKVSQRRKNKNVKVIR